MPGRFSRSLELAKVSWSVVRDDKELLLFPVMSLAALLLILGSLTVPFAVLGGFSPDAGAAGSQRGFGDRRAAVLRSGRACSQSRNGFN